MADQISFTAAHPIKVVAPTKQPINQALDVSDYDEMDLELGVVALEGASPSVTIRILTSMHNDSDDASWLIAGVFAAQTVPYSFAPLNLKNFFKYVRWEVSALSGNSATFGICGLLRRWS
jgi:hypothetical protein